MMNYMLTYEDIMFVISSISYFFQGFYVGRKNLLMFGISSLVLLISTMTRTILRGVYAFNVTIYDLTVAIIYIFFLWGIGFVMSHFIVIKETDIGNDIGKVERININDKNKMT